MAKTEEHFSKIPDSVVQGTTGNELKAYCYLARIPNFWTIGPTVGIDVIAKWCNFSHPTAQKVMKALCNKRFLTAIRKKGKATHYKPTAILIAPKKNKKTPIYNDEF